MHIKPLVTSVELGVLVPGAERLRKVNVEFMGHHDIRQLAQAFRILDGWDRASTSKNDEQG